MTKNKKKTSKNKISKPIIKQLFIPLWFIICLFLSRSEIVEKLNLQLNATAINFLYVAILVIPIASIVFSLVYNVEDQGKQNSLTRIGFAAVVTVVSAAVIWYLFFVVGSIFELLK